MTRIAFIATLATLAMTALASADDTVPDGPTSIAPHLNAGIEMLGGPSASSVGTRAHLGFDQAFGSGHIRPTFGLGGTISVGAILVSDPRSLDNNLAIGYRDYGPELTFGLRWVDGGIVDTRVFASFAFLHTDIDSRLMYDNVAGVGSDYGMRATIGVNWADQVPSWAANNHDEDAAMYSWMVYILPEQIEIGWERSQGSNRVGIAFSWGI